MIRGWLRNYLGVKECDCVKEEKKKPIEINLVIKDVELDPRYINTPAFKQNFRILMKTMMIAYYRANEFSKMDTASEILGYYESSVDGSESEIIHSKPID